ncbi:MAG: GFA family protein [Aestuariivirgaceae bacterium]
MANPPFQGSCLCGKVAYEVTGNLRDVVGCHCQQCRKVTGHIMAATAAKLVDFNIIRDDGLARYRSSDTAERGFCRTCGSSLFWWADGKDYVAITAGTLDGLTGLKIAGHIFCADKGDYYEIMDGDYQRDQSGGG